MKRWISQVGILLLAAVGFNLQAQIDPEKRQLIQIGYDQPIKGQAPIAGYAFYHRNDPGFFRTNMTLRLSIAPVYADTELGVAGGANTDWAFGAAGGGFADSYYEIRGGKWYKPESFEGHGGEVSYSVYRRFNPHQLIPLYAVARVSPHYSTYARDSDTSPAFELPEDRLSLNLRTGLRWGGREPLTFPHLAMELSGWYEGQLRSESGTYGFGDRSVEADSHRFWTRALFIYTLPEARHNMGLDLSLGTSVDADRFSAFRLGGMLPLSSEFPLALPGYYYQELSAERFFLLNGHYTLPLEPQNRVNLTLVGSVARVTYIPGMRQPGNWHYGAGLGLGYRSPRETFRMAVSYSYGFNAIRGDHRGGQNIGFLFQWDLESRRQNGKSRFYLDNPQRPGTMFELFGR